MILRKGWAVNTAIVIGGTPNLAGPSSCQIFASKANGASTF